MPEELLSFEQFEKLKKKLSKRPAQFNPNARLILKERYLKMNTIEARLETPEERYAAIAIDVASAELMNETNNIKDVEKFSEQLYDAMTSGKFQFNTPTIINFGRWKKEEGKLMQLDQMGSACFVLPINDSMVSPETHDGIMDASVAQALVHKHGGGTGYSLCRLRPSGSIIGYNPEIYESSFNWGSTAGISSGPESFLEHIFDSNTESIKQGNTRRGANMAIQRIDHPDFLAHMYAKFGVDEHSLERKLKNHNISMAVTDEFMQAAKEDKYVKLLNPHTEQTLKREDLCTEEVFSELLVKNMRNPLTKVTLPPMYLSKKGRDVINAYTGQVVGIAGDEVLIHARTVLHNIAQLAHANGEPGVIFIDRMNEYNPTPHIGEFESTNPCGEQPLLPWEACNLGSINIAKYVNEQGRLDTERLKEDIRTYVRALDNVVSRNDFPLQQITDMVNNTRKIGLGYMGVADAMVLMGVKYGSEESFEKAEEMAKVLSDAARQASFELGEEKGVFPAFEGSIYDLNSEARRVFFSKDRVMNYEGTPRNAACTTQAPTGTISRLAGCSSGIEPLFSSVTVSNIMNQKVVDISYSLKEGLRRQGIISQQALDNLDKIVATEDNQLKISGTMPSHVREELMIFKAIYDNLGNLEVHENTPKEAKPYLERIPEELKDLMVTSNGLTTEQHLRMQAVFQKYNDSSISKTINLPGSSGIDDILNVYFKAWEYGLKGITVYRDNSRHFQVLNVAESNDEVKGTKYDRPLLQMSITTELPVGNPLMKPGEYEANSEKVFTTIAYDPTTNRVNSVFQSMSFGNSFDAIDLIANNKAYSQILKMSGGNPVEVEKQLTNIPKAHHVGEVRQNGSYKDRIMNDTTQGALLKSLHVLRFLTDGYTKFDDVDERYAMIANGKVNLKKIIETQGTLEIKVEEGPPSILPKDVSLVFDPAKYIGSGCPYCGQVFRTAEDKRKYVRVSEGCPTYLCCGASKCD